MIYPVPKAEKQMIHSLFRYEKDPAHKSKYILTGYSEEYDLLLKGSNKGEIPLYLSNAGHIRSSSGRVPAFTISGAGGHISGVFIPDLKLPNLGHGDFKKHGSEDALLLIKSCDVLEIIILKDALYLVADYWSLMADQDPEFLEEMEAHRQKLRKPNLFINKG